jgi:hypothetical protein
VSAGQRRAIAVVALVLIGLGACGRKASPVPPRTRLPQPVADLTTVERADGVEVSWTVPRRRMDNSRIIDAGVARLYRTDDAGTGDPRAAILDGERVRGYTQIATFRLQEPASEYLAGNRVVYVDRQGLAYGRRYTYVATTSDAEGRTGPLSPRVSITYIAPPEAPRELRTDAHEGSVRLSWQPPAALADGGAITGPLTYEVLRAGDPIAPLTTLGRTQPGVTLFEDRGVENDRTYYYAVRAIRTDGTSTASGPAGERVAATPTKTTPPAPVADLAAVASRGEVRLSWRPSPAPDVAMYIIYRAARGVPPMRVGSVRPPATTFIDRNVPGGTYRYAVTAQDASVRANESAPSNEVTVTVP